MGEGVDKTRRVSRERARDGEGGWEWLEGAATFVPRLYGWGFLP